jgi:hypothetical protein
MIGLIAFAFVTWWEYHRHGIQGALTYVFGITMVLACVANGLPTLVAFVFVVLLCVILNRLPRKDIKEEADPK